MSDIYEEQLSTDEQGNPVSVLIQVPVISEQVVPVEEVAPVTEKPAKAKPQTPAKTSDEVSD